MPNKSLKIALLGFDWSDIAFKDIEFTKSKLDRDGLNAEENGFFLLYGGNKWKRQVVRKNPPFYTCHINLFAKLRIFYDFFFIFVLPIALALEKFKPHLFYITDFPFVLAAAIPAKICRAKVYFRLVNLPTELALAKGARGKIYYYYYKLMEKITVPLVDRFVVINETTKNYLLKLGAKEEKIVIDIPNTIARDRLLIEKADSDYIRRKHNLPGRNRMSGSLHSVSTADKKIILSIGSLIPEKGFVELIEVFAKLERGNLVLIICGRGKDENKLKQLARELGAENKIFFAGFIRREEIWHYYFGADLFMLFSKSESLGLVFWEAMYADLPVIGTRVGGVAESIGKDGERGFYWRGDAADLENKINICLFESEEKKRMINNAKEYVTERLENKTKINQILN